MAGGLRRRGGIATEVADRLRELSATVAPPLAIESSPAPATPPGQTYLLSKSTEAFFRAKRYPPHTEHQNRGTLRLWGEITGHKKPLAYTRADAFEFQDALRQLA